MMPMDPQTPPPIEPMEAPPVGAAPDMQGYTEPRGTYQPSPGMMPATPRTEGMADPLILDRVERGMAMQGEDYGTDGFYAKRGMNAMQEHGPGFMDYPSQRATMAIGAGTDPQATQDYYNSLTPGMRQQFMDMKLDDPMGQSPSPDQMRERFPPGYEPLDRNKMRDALRGTYDDAQRFDDARARDSVQAGPLDFQDYTGVYQPDPDNPGDTEVDTTQRRRVAEDEYVERNALGRLDNIMAELEANPDLLEMSNTMTGNARRNWLALRDRSGLDFLDLSPEQERELTDPTRFRQTMLLNVNRYIKDITGATVGQGDESRRLMAALPNQNDSPAEFRAKLANAIDLSRLLVARYNYMQKAGTDNMPTDSEIVGILRNRSTELTREALRNGMSPSEARIEAQRRMSEEFGI